MNIKRKDEQKLAAINVCLHKKGARMLQRKDGKWFLDGKEIDQEKAVTELVDAVQGLGYWCQVAKDVLPETYFQMVQRAYEFNPEQD